MEPEKMIYVLMLYVFVGAILAKKADYELKEFEVSFKVFVFFCWPIILILVVIDEIKRRVNK